MKLITGLDRKTWNDFVSSFPEPAILQSYEWGELKSLHGWEAIRMAVEEEGRIVAAVSILKKKLPYVPFNMFYAPRGPVLDFSKSDVLKFLLEAVSEETRKHNAIVLKIDPQVNDNEYHYHLVDTLKRHDFIHNNQNIQPRSTFVIDLFKPLEELILTFEEKTRYNIRLSERKHVIVKECSTDEGIKIFYGLYRETAHRDNFLIHPLNYYKDIKQCLVDRGLANTFIAYYEDKPIASVFTFNFGSRIWYMYGASSNEYRNLMPNHALHWHIIKWAKEKGFMSYDLFGIPSNPTDKHPLWGVYRFKKGFNGDLVKYIGVFDLPYRPVLYKLLESGISLYKNFRGLLLKGKISDSLEE